MSQMQVAVRTVLVVLYLLWGRVLAEDPVETFAVWPAGPPTRLATAGPEQVLEGRPRPFYQLTNVSEPTVSVYLPTHSESRAAVLVCPGGGLQRLAIEHEGLEVAQWLNAQGIAAFVLKYRVPAPVEIGLQDAQRALSVIRSRSDDWGIAADDMGMVGFSAGGEIGAWMATHERQYEPIDVHDQASCRPAYAALIYPGGLVAFRTREVKEEILKGIDEQTPAMFFAHAFDDSCQNSLQMALALKRARVPAELHIFEQGGHGFGVRDSGHPFAHWKHDFLRWAGTHGFLDKHWIRQYVSKVERTLANHTNLPRFQAEEAETLVSDAFVAQKRLVRGRLRDDRIAGFKGGAITEQAQRSLGLDHPLSGILFQSGRLDAAEEPTIDLHDDLPTMIETEIGFMLGVDIGYEVLSAQQARDAVAKIAAVIELPVNYASRVESPLTAQETIALNVGSDRFIVGKARSPQDVDLEALPIQLLREGNELHHADSSMVKGSQWENLKTLINQLVSQGYTIPAGSVIISGALGKIHEATPGDYTARFGSLGEISFHVQGSR